MRERAPLVCGALGVATAAAAVLRPLAAAGWAPSILARIGAATPFGAAARAAVAGLHLVSRGYDGQFYWGIAVDPLARGGLPRVFDKASYRYGHPLYGWAAWAVSGDDPHRAAAALLAVGVASLGVAAYATARLAQTTGHSPWFGLAVAFNPGLLASVRLDLAEPFAAALLACALLAHARRQRRLLWVLLALLPLAKEPLALVVVAVAGWELLQRRPRGAALAAAALLPAAAWWAYLRLHLGAFFTSGATALAPPLVGWGRTFADGHRLDPLELALLTGVLVLLAVAVVGAVRRRDPVAFAYLALGVFVVLLADNATAAFTTALRNVALALMLAPFALAGLRPDPGDRRYAG